MPRFPLPHVGPVGQLARLCRRESWVRTMPPMTPAELAEWGRTAPRWLETLPADPPPR